jgi:lipopolysaccharide transport system ATP-binding protein
MQRSRYWALSEISFTLRHGETLGVIGRNGAGKSTLLRLLANIIGPDCGSIWWEPGYTASLLSLQAGFQGTLSGRDNALLSGILMGLSWREMQRRIPGVIDFSELGDAIDAPVHTYSTGMKARLGFAVAFQIDPDVLLVDEVMGVGDADFKEKSSEALKERIRSDRTVVVVSHNTGTLKDLCQRLVWIEDGRTRMEGDVDDVLAYYPGGGKKAASPSKPVEGRTAAEPSGP